MSSIIIIESKSAYVVQFERVTDVFAGHEVSELVALSLNIKKEPLGSFFINLAEIMLFSQLLLVQFSLQWFWR